MVTITFTFYSYKSKSAGTLCNCSHFPKPAIFTYERIKRICCDRNLFARVINFIWQLPTRIFAAEKFGNYLRPRQEELVAIDERENYDPTDDADMNK